MLETYYIYRWLISEKCSARLNLHTICVILNHCALCHTFKCSDRGGIRSINVYSNNNNNNNNNKNDNNNNNNKDFFNEDAYLTIINLP